MGEENSPQSCPTAGGQHGCRQWKKPGLSSPIDRNNIIVHNNGVTVFCGAADSITSISKQHSRGVMCFWSFFQALKIHLRGLAIGWATLRGGTGGLRGGAPEAGRVA